MADIIPFVPRNVQTRKPMTVSEGSINLKAIEAEIAASLWGAGIDSLAWPGMDIQASYMAPESDPA